MREAFVCLGVLSQRGHTCPLSACGGAHTRIPLTGPTRALPGGPTNEEPRHGGFAGASLGTVWSDTPIINTHAAEHMFFIGMSINKQQQEP